jgi:hypothetical protein
MLEQRIRIVSEALARAVNRRTFLRQTGSVVVSGVTALAMGHLLATNPARAAVKKPMVPSVPNCAPPGPYCNYEGGNPPQPDSCHGAHCYQHFSNGQVQTCQVYYAFYNIGCWTASGQGGFWTCCDCQCTGGSSCGCAQFTGTPATLSE